MKNYWLRIFNWFLTRNCRKSFPQQIFMINQADAIKFYNFSFWAPSNVGKKHSGSWWSTRWKFWKSFEMHFSIFSFVERKMSLLSELGYNEILRVWIVKISQISCICLFVLAQSLFLWILCTRQFLFKLEITQNNLEKLSKVKERIQRELNVKWWLFNVELFCER